jgi:DNA replication protein DnaC
MDKMDTPMTYEQRRAEILERDGEAGLRLWHQRERSRLMTLSCEEIAQERNNVCPYCGALMVPERRPYTYTLGGVREERVYLIWPSKCGCAQEAEALAGQQKAAFANAWERKQQEFDQLLRRSGLTGRLFECSFDSFGPRDDWADSDRMLARAKLYAGSVLAGCPNRKPWLTMQGAVGTGKSHLAAAIVRHVLENGWVNCYFRVWPSYVQRLQLSWKRERADTGEREEDIVRELSEGRLLVLDDLDVGEGPTSAWERRVLFAALNERYNNFLPTVLTFNHATAQQLGRVLGERLLDRLVESSYDTLIFDGPSYRTRGVLR